MKQFDVAIIGAGLGGLVSAAILADEGYSVCVIEKNEQIGGNLQTFRRDGIVFDTGVHYVGGLGEGQNLYHLFDYLGIIDDLKLERMDDECFDAIIFDGDDTVYPQAMGYSRFKKNLLHYFPEEENAIDTYIQKMKEACSEFPFYNLKNENYTQNITLIYRSADAVIAEITPNKKLQAVLAGNNLLYAGVENKTPFFIHALIVNSYIEGAYKILNGGDSIAKLLARKIKAKGGKIFKKQKVTKIDCEENIAKFVHTDKGNIFEAKYILSNISPSATLAITAEKILKPAFKNRLSHIKNTISPFCVYLSLHENKVNYQKTNYYYFDNENVWDKTEYTQNNWPNTYAMYFSRENDTAKYADALTIIAYMKYEEVAAWENTFSTHDNKNQRGESYEQFKQQKAAIILDKVRKKFPWLKADVIKNIYTSSPLTYRDYIGTTDGNLYGIQRDQNELMRTTILPVSKIQNMFFVGQNINLHGVFGVTVSGIIGAACILGKQYLFDKIIYGKENS